MATQNASEINHIFNQIGRIIEGTWGYQDVQITDGITDLTQLVRKTGLTNLPAGDDFTYRKERPATAEEITDPTKLPAGTVLEA